jgi:dihydroorotate dehydrogenase
MNLYPLVKPCLFAMDAERAHNLTLKTLDKVHALGLGFLSQEKIARDDKGSIMSSKNKSACQNESQKV